MRVIVLLFLVFFADCEPSFAHSTSDTYWDCRASGLPEGFRNFLTSQRFQPGDMPGGEAQLCSTVLGDVVKGTLNIRADYDPGGLLFYGRYTAIETGATVEGRVLRTRYINFAVMADGSQILRWALILNDIVPGNPSGPDCQPIDVLPESLVSDLRANFAVSDTQVPTIRPLACDGDAGYTFSYGAGWQETELQKYVVARINEGGVGWADKASLRVTNFTSYKNIEYRLQHQGNIAEITAAPKNARLLASYLGRAIETDMLPWTFDKPDLFATTDEKQWFAGIMNKVGAFKPYEVRQPDSEKSQFEIAYEAVGEPRKQIIIAFRLTNDGLRDITARVATF